MKFKIKEGDHKKRLDKFLTENLPDLSRSQIQKVIKNKKVLVNGRESAVHCWLKTDDVVEFLPNEKKDALPADRKVQKNFFSIDDIKIIFESEEFLVVNKPAGLTVHGGDGVQGENLADLLLPKYPRLAKIGEDPARPGIVHRLDKEVSGLMVVALTQDSFDNLKKQFQKRTVVKSYLALVYGQVSKEEDEIRFPIKRSTSLGRMAAMPETNREEKNAERSDARRAISSFKIKERFINYTLLEVKIKTGRTHQIRVHMLAYGHPIAGDNLYSTARTRALNKKLAFSSIFLTAYKLSFKNLAGETMSFRVDPPVKLKRVMKEIK